MRLVNANNIIPVQFWGKSVALTVTIAQVEEWIENSPAVDAVEVVRCRDCDHTDLPIDEEDEHDYWCMTHGSYVYEDDFCSYGERRTE